MCDNKPIDPTRIGGDVAELERCPSDAMYDLLVDDRHHESDPGTPWWNPTPLLPISGRVIATNGKLSTSKAEDASQQSVVTSRSPSLRRSATRKQENALRQAEERIDNIRQRMAITILVVGLLAAFCFLRGASAPIEQTRAIEDIRPGHKVIVDAPEEALATDVARLNDLDSSWNASDGSLEIDGIADPLRALTDATPAQLQQADYRLVLLQAKEVWEDGTYNEINVQTLQPWQWLHENEVHVGGEAPLPLETVEMNLPVGMTGKVIDILPCPEIEGGRGRVVLTTVNRLARGVIELTLRDADGKEETLRPTDEHLFYSASHGDWLAAGELQVGERLNGVSGPITIAAITPLSGTHRVYNMTVQGEHLYRVAECGVLVHNSCPDELIRFGQKRISETFRLYGPNSKLAGKTVGQVASQLRNGDLVADDIAVYVFRYKDRLFAESNRGLAALSLAGKKPTKIIEIGTTKALKKRVDEMLQEGREGLVIPVTRFKDGTGGLFDILLPL